MITFYYSAIQLSNIAMTISCLGRAQVIHASIQVRTFSSMLSSKFPIYDSNVLMLLLNEPGLHLLPVVC